MMNKPNGKRKQNKEAVTLSVVMAIYNAGKGLMPTLESLQAQTFTGFELILIDDGSTDGTWQTISALEWSWIRTHRNGQNIGQTASLNIGLSLARGKYIARHDAEDISPPDRFEKQVAFLDANPDIVLVGGQIDWVDDRGQIIRHFDYPLTNDEIQDRLKTKNSFAHGSVMFRREILESVDGYREAFKLAQDYDLWFRVAEKHPVANLPDTLYTMAFSTRMASVGRNAEQNAYAALARKLAKERQTSPDGRESSDILEATTKIAETYAQRGFIERRRELSENRVIWGERLLWWGKGAESYAWPMWWQAMIAYPLNLRVWKFLARELLKPFRKSKINWD